MQAINIYEMIILYIKFLCKWQIYLFFLLPPCACVCNQLFRLMHRLSYHIATSCIIKRENARGGTRDLYHAPSFCTVAKT